MAAPVNRILSPTQADRLKSWDVGRAVDIHCHCLPGLDDGPATMAASVELCRRLVDDGVTTVVASPHQLGRYDGLNTARRIFDRLQLLQTELASLELPLEVFAGADVRIDERIVKLVASEEVITVHPSRKHLLLELPHQTFVEPLPVIHSLNSVGVQVIMTHPERHQFLAGSVRRLRNWIDAGAGLQLTAGCFLGDFGRRAAYEAWRLAESGMVSVVASDAHDAINRPPRMSAAVEILASELGDEYARQVCLVNPSRVLEGEKLTPCSPAT